MIYNYYQIKPKTNKKKYYILVFIFCFLAFGYFKNSTFSVAPQQVVNFNRSAKNVHIGWPKDSQAAIGATGYGVLAKSSPKLQKKPIASTAKIMTAYAILKHKPLKVGEQGPLITITAKDVALYKHYVALDGSVVPVNVGEKISQYQALQAILLPSSNNMSDTLAVWAFGSMDNYLIYANNLAKQMGLNDTTISDASGFSPKTVSTPNDLVILSQTAMANPVFAQIVAQAEATIPVAGKIKNYNHLLGSNGIVGVKTGNTDEAGGCFVFASKKTIGKHNVTIIGAVTGAPTRLEALKQSDLLVNESVKNFEIVKIASPNQAVAEYKTPWSSSAKAITKDGIEILRWQGNKISGVANIKKATNKSRAHDNIGSVEIIDGSNKHRKKLELNKSLHRPSFWWRLLHFYIL